MSSTMIKALQKCVTLCMAASKRNLAIANRSRISCTNKLSTKLPSKVTQDHRKCHGSIKHIQFLLAFHGNYGHIFYRFPHIARYWLKIAKILYPTGTASEVTTYRRIEICILLLLLNAPISVTQSKFCKDV